MGLNSAPGRELCLERGFRGQLLGVGVWCLDFRVSVLEFRVKGTRRMSVAKIVQVFG